MRNVGKFVVMLSLIAMAPSYAKKNGRPNEGKKTNQTVNSSRFKGLENLMVFVDNTYTGDEDGSAECPFSTLEAAQKHSQPGQIIYVRANPGVPYTAGSGSSPAIITLKKAQSLISSGCTFKIGEAQILAATPGEFAEILVDGENTSTGVLMGDSNRVAGFLIKGIVKKSLSINSPLTGISSSNPRTEKGNNRLQEPPMCGDVSIISRNSFQNLDNGIDLKVQDWSTLDILSNHFSNVAFGILLRKTDGVTAKIRNNSFAGMQQVCIQSWAGTPIRGKELIKLLPKDAKKSAPATAPLPSSSDAAELFIKNNYFTGSAAGAILAFGAKKVEVQDNDISGDFTSGLRIDQLTEAISTVHLSGNSLVGDSLLKLKNVQATVRHNTFDDGIFGLVIDVFGDATASVISNKFNNYMGCAFMLCAEENPCNCLKLVKNSSTNSPIDFQLQNLSMPPSALEVVVSDPSDGPTSLSNANDGGSVRIYSNDSAVTFVHQYTGCAEPND